MTQQSILLKIVVSNRPKAFGPLQPRKQGKNQNRISTLGFQTLQFLATFNKLDNSGA